MDKKKNKNAGARHPTPPDGLRGTGVPSASIDKPIDPEAVKKQADEYLAGWQRALADYENLKRSGEMRASESRVNGHREVLRELLSVVDSFEQAQHHAPSDDVADARVGAWLKGLAAIESQLMAVLERFHLSKIEPTGPFDPSLHHAVGTRNEPEAADGAILQVLQTGWKMDDSVLRPAYVIINDLS